MIQPSEVFTAAPLRRSLQRRVVISVLLGLGVVLIGLGSLVTVAFNDTTTAVKQERLALAQMKEHELLQEMESGSTLLARIARTAIPPRALRDPREGAKLLRHVLDTLGAFSGLAILDEEGRLIAGAGNPLWLRWLQSSPEALTFRAGDAGAVFEAATPAPGVGVAAPIRGAEGERRWLVGVLLPSLLNNHLLPDRLGSGIFGGQVLTLSGNVVATTPGQERFAPAHAALIGDLARRRQPGMVLHEPSGGKPHYVAYVPLATPSGWGLFIEQPQDVVVALPRRLRRWMLLTGLVVLLAGGLVASLDVRRVTRPLQRLTEAAARIGQGDLATGVAVDGDDEVGLLGRTLEHMRVRLQRSLDETQERERSVAALRERERIARELHDGLAQTLAAVHATGSTGKVRLTRGNTAGAERALDEIIRLSNQGYQEVRQSIFGLRVMVSRGLGLIPAVTEYLHEFSERTGLPVRLVVDPAGPPTLAADVETQLIRIIQEALTNAARHAQARAATVWFGLLDGMAGVVIEDDGLGFDPAGNSPDRGRHFGLATMRERAESVGGALRLTSAPGAGTRVEVRLPLNGKGDGNGDPGSTG